MHSSLTPNNSYRPHTWMMGLVVLNMPHRPGLPASKSCWHQRVWHIQSDRTTIAAPPPMMMMMSYTPPLPAISKPSPAATIDRPPNPPIIYFRTMVCILYIWLGQPTRLSAFGDEWCKLHNQRYGCAANPTHNAPHRLWSMFMRLIISQV